jgi:hypothetical protein
MNYNVYMVEYKGEKYPTREIELEPYIENSGVVRIADVELWNAIKEDCESGLQDAEDMDNEIYYYTDSGFLASIPTDTEIIYSVLRGEYWDDDFKDEWWYSLMRNATFEINLMHERGEINCNIESYECSGRYSVYGYTDGMQHSLYEGKDARMAAMAAISALTTIRLMNHSFWSVTEGRVSL